MNRALFSSCLMSSANHILCTFCTLSNLACDIIYKDAGAAPSFRGYQPRTTPTRQFTPSTNPWTTPCRRSPSPHHPSVRMDKTTTTTMSTSNVGVYSRPFVIMNCKSPELTHRLATTTMKRYQSSSGQKKPSSPPTKTFSPPDPNTSTQPVPSAGSKASKKPFRSPNTSERLSRCTWT